MSPSGISKKKYHIFLESQREIDRDFANSNFLSWGIENSFSGNWYFQPLFRYILGIEILGTMKKMLQECKNCSYYERLYQFGHITLHHYCHYHRMIYTLLKLQSKIRYCPDSPLNNEGNGPNSQLLNTFIKVLETAK